MKQRVANEADKNIGTRIRARRIAIGMSQQTLGDKLGVSFQQVQKYEKGTNRVGGSRIVQIAAALDLPVSALFGMSIETDTPDMLPMLATRDGAKLAGYFNSIVDPAHRDAVVKLARQFADIAAIAQQCEIAGVRFAMPAETTVSH